MYTLGTFQVKTLGLFCYSMDRSLNSATTKVLERIHHHKGQCNGAFLLPNLCDIMNFIDNNSIDSRYCSNDSGVCALYLDNNGFILKAWDIANRAGDPHYLQAVNFPNTIGLIEFVRTGNNSKSKYVINDYYNMTTQKMVKLQSPTVSIKPQDTKEKIELYKDPGDALKAHKSGKVVDWEALSRKRYGGE